jgi:hypothetical protein
MAQSYARLVPGYLSRAARWAASRNSVDCFLGGQSSAGHLKTMARTTAKTMVKMADGNLAARWPGDCSKAPEPARLAAR